VDTGRSCGGTVRPSMPGSISSLRRERDELSTFRSSLPSNQSACPAGAGRQLHSARLRTKNGNPHLRRAEGPGRDQHIEPLWASETVPGPEQASAPWQRRPSRSRCRAGVHHIGMQTRRQPRPALARRRAAELQPHSVTETIREKRMPTPPIWSGRQRWSDRLEYVPDWSLWPARCGSWLRAARRRRL
jgi:hypothetical protein